ncbi:MAG: hypothetical protein RLZZ299_1194 [Pseudomonadota bacterium]
MARTLYCPACLTTFREDENPCPNLGCGGPRPGNGWPELLGPGDLLDRHYRVLRVLALAGGGVTYLAREVDNQGDDVPPDLAIKILYAHRETPEHLRRLANEAQVLQHLAHENIVEGRGFVHRRGAPPYLITTFERGGTLHEHIRRVGPLPPKVAGRILRQIALALGQAHARGVVHRDLKPQNVLLCDPVERDEAPRIRVADFGIAKLTGALGDGLTRAGTFMGTPEFAAPEQFVGHPPTPATDIFALGATLHFLVTGRPSFVMRDRQDVIGAYEELSASMPPRISGAGPAWERVGAILRATMNPESESRTDIPGLLALLDALERAPDTGPDSAPDAGHEARATLSPDGRPRDRATWMAEDVISVIEGHPTASPDEEPPQTTLIGDDAYFADAGAEGGAPPSATPPPPAPPESTALPPLPATPAARLALVGEVSELVARELAGQLSALPPDQSRALAQATLAHRPGGPPAVGVGVARLAFYWSRVDWTSRVRPLLTDPDMAVREAAVTAIGAIGQANALSALPPLAADPEPRVRSACAHALVDAAVRARRPDLVRVPLQRLAGDADRAVRAAAEAALQRLEG